MSMKKIPRRTDPNYITPWLKYKDQVNGLTTAAGSFARGNVYSLGYNFSKEYDYRELMFYDYMPLIYVVDINPEKKYFTAINLHHFPVTFREQWFKSIISGKRQAVPSIVETLLPFLTQDIPKKFTKYSYERQKQMMWWVKYGVRNYRFDRVLQTRFVTPENTSTILKLYADTFYATTGVQKVKHFYTDVYRK